MKRWIAVAALVLGLLPGVVYAQEVTEGTTSPNKSGPAPHGWDGSRWRHFQTTAGGLQRIQVEPSVFGPVTKVYYDTLSALTRAVDSLIVPVDVRNLEGVTFGCKLEGAGVSGIYRVAFQVRWHTSLTSDSNSTWTDPARFFTSGLVDSLLAQRIVYGSTVIGTAAGGAWPHEATLLWDIADGLMQGWSGRWIPLSFTVPPGVIGVTFKVRVISTPLSATAANPFRFRVDMAGRTR